MTLGLPISFPSENAPLVNREDIIVNALFVASLSCSVMAAFGAMAGKQVISHAFVSLDKSSHKKSALNHQRALDAGKRRRFEVILDALFALLQLAILLFFAGLSFYLWNRGRPIATLTLSFGCAGTAGYIILYKLATASCNLRGHWLPVVKVLRFVVRCAFVLIGMPGLEMNDLRSPDIIILGSYCVFLLAVIGPVIIREVADGLAVFAAGGTLLVALSPIAPAVSLFVALVAPIFDRFQSKQSSAPGSESAQVSDNSKRIKPDPLTQVADQRKLEKARDEFRCVQWALVEAPTEDIAFEAARLIPRLRVLDHVQELWRHPIAVDNLLSHFLKSIISESSRPSDSLVVYSAAMCHILLSQPPMQLNRRALTSVYRELQKVEGICSFKGISLLTDILAYGFRVDERKIGYRHRVPILPRAVPLQLHLLDDVVWRAENVLPFVYLSLGLNDGNAPEYGTIGYITQRAQRLPLLQVVFLRLWCLSDLHREHNKSFGSEGLERRWRAYTSCVHFPD